MEINSPNFVYQTFSLSNLQKPLTESSEPLQAVPYEGTAFDNIKELIQYQSQSANGDKEPFESVGTKLPLIDAKETSHSLANGYETTRNINLYAVNMSERAQEHTTQATVYIDDTFVALQTTDDQLEMPFKPRSEQGKFDRVSQLLEQSGGDFSTFIEKLTSEFGDKVKVETFGEDEGPDYAEAHLLLNGTTFEEFINEQTSQMNKIKSIREMTQEQLEHTSEGDMPYGLQVPDKSKIEFVNAYNDISKMT